MAKVVVVLPTYNEIANLAPMVEALVGLPVADLKVLIVDDNSPDGTGALADQLARRDPDRVSVMHRAKKAGLGAAYVDAFRKVLGNCPTYVVQMDADFSHQPKYIPQMVAAVENSDLVIASRYVKGGSVDESWSPFRKLLSWFANRIYVPTLLNMPIYDATGGFRVWRYDTLVGLDLNRVCSKGYVFMVEMAYITHQLGFKVTEIPIHFPERERGKSKMSARIQIEAAQRVWEIRRRHHNLNPRMRSTELRLGSQEMGYFGP